MALRSVIACSLLVCAGVPAHAAVFTVGALADAACTHTTIASAVASAAANGPAQDEIRIAGNQPYTGIALNIAGQSLRLRGGFSDCADTTASGQTTLRGGNAASATIRTSGSSSFNTLSIEDLVLADGNNLARDGGAVAVTGSYLVELSNVRVVNNLAARGGGVFVDTGSGGGVLLSDDTRIDNNIADIAGGGIYCRGGASVLIASGSVLDNEARDNGADPVESGNGGGIALFGCIATQPGQPGVRGVIGNQAARNGGGWYLRAGAALTLSGDGTAPALITTNVAGNGGGGIAVNDPSPPSAANTSQVFVYNSWIDTNLAQRGGGIALLAGGDVQMRRTLQDDDCHNTPVCSSLSHNDRNPGDASCFGAAAFVGPGARLRLYNTYIESNCPSDAGWAFRQSHDSRLEVDSSVIARNGGSSPFFIEGTGNFTGLLQLAWTTVTGHFDSVRGAMFTLPSASPGSTGTLRVYGSLLGEPFLDLTAVGGLGDAPPMTLAFDCLLTDPVFDGSGASRVVMAASPYGMIDPANGTYRPSGASAAMVDLCDASAGERVAGDVLGLDTIFDAARANVHGPRDAGAFEWRGAGDVLLRDGFEDPS